MKKVATHLKSIDRQPSPALAEAIAMLPADQQEKYEKFRRRYDYLVQVVMIAFYELGLIASEIVDEVTFVGRPPQMARTLNVFAAALGISRRLLDDLRHLVATIDKQEYASIISRAPICMAHVWQLRHVSFRDQRDQLVEQVVAENLDPDELMRRICREPKKPKQPRVPRPPKNLKQGLAAALKKTKSLYETYDKSIFSEKYDLAGEVIFGDPEKLTPDIRMQLDEAVTAMHALAAQASSNADRLRKAIAMTQPIDQQMKSADSPAAAPRPSAPSTVPAVPIRRLRS